jgi:hypothetical protein
VTTEELLDRVIDRDSFIAFVSALADERREAQRLEQEEPIRYQLGGALNWQNGDIASFLEAALCYFDGGPFHQPEAVPSWRMLAEFLYFGKIYE